MFGSVSVSKSSLELDDRLTQRLLREILLESTEPHSVENEKEKEEGGEKLLFGEDVEDVTMKGWRVLLADDSELNLKLLSRKFTSGPFEKLGWKVETARAVSDWRGGAGEGRRNERKRRRRECDREEVRPGRLR